MGEALVITGGRGAGEVLGVLLEGWGEELSEGWGAAVVICTLVVIGGTEAMWCNQILYMHFLSTQMLLFLLDHIGFMCDTYY